MAEKREEQKQEETLDQTFTKLEEVIRKMEAEDISLEESFALYHKGMDMLKSCSDKIDTIEKKMLVLDEEGEVHEFEQ
ncbi:MAG TPA: exodeoxyribonuclease VII small subunit [Candidatus Dorea gallistercoris]|uniref:Exodeoxyribonuclease 7 small subunit n=1 Tax=Candidatus Dorea gallistercoris TaxID=2838542 RepID=A0A9D1UF78_9FIRM|nr:exodeoxyribonuclease VII small subunit [Candidatus Dorea gallistercoris]